jgi:hypothetical protein
LDAESNPRSTPAGGAGMSGRLRRLAGRRLPLLAEMGFLGLVIGLWELARVPLQGSLPAAIEHAHDWLSLERALHVDVEASLIRFTHRAGLESLLRFGYDNLHLPVLFGFMALARLLRPERYPFLRSAFVLSHVPALLVIGVYPLAPPRWVAGMPFAAAAPDGLNGGLHNATAAAASQHVGYPLFIAAATVWLAPRPRLAWLAFGYPLAVFAIVVGTGNHFTLDAIVGGLCIAAGFALARLLHGPVSGLARDPAAPVGVALLAAAGYALIVRALESGSSLTLPTRSLGADDLVLLAGIAAVVASWRLARATPRRAPRRVGGPRAQDA